MNKYGLGLIAMVSFVWAFETKNANAILIAVIAFGFSCVCEQMEKLTK